MGFVSRSLSFIPAHIPLYSLVPVVVENLNLADRPQSFFAVEEFLKKHMRFLPLLITLDNQPLNPWDKRGRELIETLFLSSRYGVALDNLDRSALENRLFETEVILSRDRRKNGGPTIFEGAFFFYPAETVIDGTKLVMGVEGINDFELADILVQCQFGGERNKGFGSLADVTLEEINDVAGVEPDLVNNCYPLLPWPKNLAAPFCLQYDENLQGLVSGSLRPFCGRRFHETHGFGNQASDNMVVWDMGWKVKEDIKVILEYDRACALVS